MIDYATYRRIHHLNEAETLNVAQIAGRLALDPRTVRYWLDEPTFRPRQTAPRPSKLDPYKPLIRQWLEHYPYSGTQIFQRLGDAGYTGGISIVREYIQRVRPKTAPAFLTLHFEPGECAQVDWGHYGSVNVGNTRRQLSFFVLVLCYSRMMYVEFTVSQTLEHFLGCHLNAFEALGGAGAGEDHGRQPQIRGVAALERRGAGVQSPLRRLCPPLRLYDRTLQRRRRPREGTGRGRGGLRQEEPPGRS